MAINVLDEYYLGITAIVTVVYQLIFFSIAFSLKFDKLTDFAGGSNFILVSALTLGLSSGDPSNTPSARQIVASLFLILWSLRLALFLAYRVHKTGKDDRFDDKRDSFFPFLGFWIFQMIWVFTISLPVTILNSPAVRETPGGRTVEFGTARDVIGLIMWALGWLLESVADWQRFEWREKNKMAAGQGQWCETGVWKWSRHPNYFGEMLLQFGIYTIAVTPAFHDEANLSVGAKAALHASIAGPVLLTLLLLFVSGMNLSERSGAKRRWEIGGHVWEGYKAYLDRTSILIPMPQLIWKGLPRWVKGTAGFQWPLYRFAPELHGAVRQGDNAGAGACDDDGHRDRHEEGGRRSAGEGLV